MQADEKDPAHRRADASGREGIGTGTEINVFVPGGVRRAQNGAEIAGVCDPVKQKAPARGGSSLRFRKGEHREDALRGRLV